VRTARLGEVCVIRSGGTPSRSRSDYYGGSVPWAKIADIESSDGQLYSTEETITEAGLAAIRGRLFPTGTLLFAIYGSIGKMAFCGRPVATNQAILGIEIPSDETINSRYLYRYLESLRSKLLNDGVGVTQKNLSAAYVRDIAVPLPSLSEQRRIAAILDQADALRRLRRQSLSRLSDVGQAIFFEMFVAGPPANEPPITVDELVDREKGGIRTGPFGSQLLHSEFVDEGIAVLGIDNAVFNEFRWGKPRHITPEKYAALKRYKVHPGDILITIMGTCGRCAIVPDGIGDAINTKHLCCISLDPERCTPEFLHAYFLHHPTVRQYLGVRSKGAIMDGLNMGIIKELPIQLPSINQQREFGERLAQLKAPLESTAKAQTALESMFTSLQHRAFRGEL